MTTKKIRLTLEMDLEKRSGSISYDEACEFAVKFALKLAYPQISIDSIDVKSLFSYDFECLN